ncbi:MAG: hypothetical protein HQL54_05155 [Magnetococcales bacterium]|nr:hypothetical protein [Magnetococcales bacterium]
MANQNSQSLDECLTKVVQWYFEELEEDRMQLESARTSLAEWERSGEGVTLENMKQEIGCVKVQ